MMRYLAAYIVRGRMQAILVAAAAALLALLLPPLSYLSGAAVALVTLRQGMQRGLEVILGAGVAASLLSLLIRQPPQIGLVFILALWMPVWGLALNLRRTARPASSVLLALLFGVMAVTSFHLAIGDPVQWWRDLLQELLQQASDGLQPAERQTVEQNLALLAEVLTGVMAAGLTLSLLGCLFLGRWWQALLYNPGGFGEEFRRLRLGKVAAAIAMAMVAGFSLTGQESGLLRDLLAVVQVAFAVQGVALVHAVVRSRRAHPGWLAVMYLTLLLLTGQTTLLLAMAGMIDNWADFRRRFGRKDGADN